MNERGEGSGNKRRISFNLSKKPYKFQKSLHHPSPVRSSSSSSPSSSDPLPDVNHDSIPSCYRERCIMPRNLGNRRRFYGVEGFWDFENTHLPSGFNVKDLKKMINAGLKEFHPMLYLNQIVGVGNTSGFKNENFAYLKSKFKLTKLIPRERFCKKCAPVLPASHVRKTDEADSRLQQGMLFYGFDIQPPGNILVITGDKDFASAIKGLKDRGFTMFVAHPKEFSEELNISGTLSWYWNDLLEGKGNYQSTVGRKRKQSNFV